MQPTSKKSQQTRILKRLRSAPATTIQLRKEEDILMPGARIFELRHEHGHNIKLSWTNQPTDTGTSHRVGKYILCPGKWENKNVKN